MDLKVEKFSDLFYESVKNLVKVYIEDFSRIYENKLFIVLSNLIDLCDIEVGFVV